MRFRVIEFGMPAFADNIDYAIFPKPFDYVPQLQGFRHNEFLSLS